MNYDSSPRNLKKPKQINILLNKLSHLHFLMLPAPSHTPPSPRSIFTTCAKQFGFLKIKLTLSLVIVSVLTGYSLRLTTIFFFLPGNVNLYLKYSRLKYSTACPHAQPHRAPLLRLGEISPIILLNIQKNIICEKNTNGGYHDRRRGRCKTAPPRVLLAVFRLLRRVFGVSTRPNECNCCYS